MAYPYAPAAAVPLDQPLYGASFAQALGRFFRKYATFSGRASRSEYWWVALASGVVNLGLQVLGLTTAVPDASETVPGAVHTVVSFVYLAISLGLFIPGLAVTVRRLHDAGHSGWSLLFVLIPIVGGIVVVVFAAEESDPAGQRFDRPRPYAPTRASRGKRVLISALSVLLVIVITFLVREGIKAVTTPSTADKVKTAVAEITKQYHLPQKIDSVTTMTGITAEDSTFHYEYTISSKVDPATFPESLVRDSVTSGNCSAPSQKRILDEGAAMRYTYKFENSEKTFEFTVTKSAC